MEPTNKLLTVELYGLSSVDKLLVDTNHKLVQTALLARQIPFLSEILASELSNGLLKSSSRDAELLLESDLLWVRMEDQEVLPTLNLIAMLLLLKL